MDKDNNMTKDEALKMAIETFEFEGVRNEEGLNVLNACKEALEQPKEQQYMYVYRMAGQHNVEFRFWDTKTDAPTYVGKIKLEVDDD